MIVAWMFSSIQYLRIPYFTKWWVTRNKSINIFATVTLAFHGCYPALIRMFPCSKQCKRCVLHPWYWHQACILRASIHKADERFHKITRSLETTGFELIPFQSLWYLTGTSCDIIQCRTLHNLRLDTKTLICFCCLMFPHQYDRHILLPLT